MNIITRAGNSIKYRLGYRDILLQDLTVLLDRIPTDFGGSCSLQKAYVMSWLIRRFKLQSTVDIGVYRGGSLFPQALAHQRYTKGIVYAVDPWSSEEAREKDNPELFEQLEEWADTTDFEAIYRSVAKMAEEFGPHCVIVRKPSRDAAGYFKAEGINFDMVHIDGNHDMDNALGDVEMYVPLLRPDGFVVMDDIGWESVRPAYDLCASLLTLVYERHDVGYAVFRNSKNIASLQDELAYYISF
jgi:hypothetical protein